MDGIWCIPSCFFWCLFFFFFLVINFNWRALYHSATIWIIFRNIRFNSWASWLWRSACATKNQWIQSKFHVFFISTQTYTLFKNLKFAPHRISSQLVLSLNSSPTLNSLFNADDQHFPGYSGWIPDSPAIHTARSAHSNDEMSAIEINTNNTKQSFIFCVLVFTTTGLILTLWRQSDCALC